jgi:hypothetical protein
MIPDALEVVLNELMKKDLLVLREVLKPLDWAPSRR